VRPPRWLLLIFAAFGIGVGVALTFFERRVDAAPALVVAGLLCVAVYVLLELRA
jgi:hypothetical protein